MLIFLLSLDQEDRDLVNKLYDKLHIQMYRMALGILKDPHQAEEALSNTFLKIMDNIEKISKLPCPQMEAYSVSILKNESFNILRREKKYLPVEDLEYFEKNPTNNPIEEIINKEILKDLVEKLEALEEKDRLLITYRYGRKMSYREIARLFSISEEAAKKRGQRIIEKLRQAYEEGEDSER